MNSNRLDFILIPTMLMCFLISSYFLVADQLNFTLSKSASIAQVISMSNTVKTKRTFNHHWINTNEGEGLSSDDQIFTYDNSFAEIKLLNGPSISISPNTLITIDKVKSTSSIDVKQGMILADLSNYKDGLEIKYKDKTILLNSSNAKIQIRNTSDGQTVDLLSGSLTYKSGQETKEVIKNQRLEINSNEISVKRVPITPISPKNAHIFIQSNKVRFNWNSDKKGTGFVSRSMNFENSKEISKAKDYKFKEGVYYWKVISNKIEGPISFFKVIPLQSTTLLSPKENSILIMSSISRDIDFTWEDKYHKDFTIEIEGPKTKISKTLNSNRLTYKFNKTGSYKWRIRPQSSVATWTKYKTFEVAPPFLPAPPKVISPKQNELISLFDKAKISFRWRGDKNSKYELTWAPDSSFSKDQATKIITGNSHEWSPKKSATYFFKVREIDTKARDTPFSRSLKINIELISNNNFIPKTGSKVLLQRPKEEVTFKWKKSITIDGARPIYYLEVSEDQNFKELLVSKKEFTNSSKVVFPKVGQYFWRTKVKYPNKEISYGLPQRVTVTPTPAPTTPIIKDLEIEIKVNSILETIKSIFSKAFDIIFPSVNANEFKTSADITWDSIEGTKFYVIEIYEANNLDKLISSKKVEQNNFKLNGVKEGVYFWRIATIDHWDRQSNFSNLSKIILNLPNKFKVVAKTKLISPKNNSKYISKKKSIKFKWKEVSNSSKYILYISKNKNFNKIYVKRTLQKNNYNIKLSASRYYWKIESYNSFNYMSTSKISSLSIKAPVYKKTKKKKISKIQKKEELKSSFFYVQYDILSSSVEQSYSDYLVQASDLVFTSFSIGNEHYLSPHQIIDSRIRRFSGEVFEVQSYGVTSIESKYLFEIYKTKFFAGAGISINKYSSYIREGTLIKSIDQSDFSVPLLLRYDFKLFSYDNIAQLTYSIGDLNVFELKNFLQINKRFSIGLSYESFSKELESSDLEIKNLNLSFRYHINY